VLAVLECFLDQAQAPDPRVLQLLHAVAAQFGNALRRKLAERRLHRLAHYDALTDLPNRVLFVDRLERALAETARHGGTLGLIVGDLDHFKEVNDRHGHAAGDATLRATVRCLQDGLRQGDELYRYGGEEFLVLLPEVPGPGAVIVAGRLRKAVASEELEAGDLKLPVTVSAGVAARLDEGPESVDTLVARAEEALALANECPAAEWCTIEIRKVAPCYDY
jgi:diguanylate cyclase (GGDEF)-like protein